jgi:hypothetical protein
VRHLKVDDNPALVSVNGLDGLETAQSLWIEGNRDLESLRALANLQSVQHGLRITHNASLAACEAAWLRDSIGTESLAHVDVDDNSGSGTCP